MGAITGKFYSREEEKERVLLQDQVAEQRAAGGAELLQGQRVGANVLESCR